MQTSERHSNYKVVSTLCRIGFGQIAKENLFHEVVPTIITTILPMENGHSIGAELLVSPVRDPHRFPGHTFYKNSLACEACCENVILAEAESSTKAWACHVNSQLWYRSDCDFQSLSVLVPSHRSLRFLLIWKQCSSSPVLSSSALLPKPSSRMLGCSCSTMFTTGRACQ